MTNVDTRPRRWGIWAHTQLDAGVPGSDDYNRLMRAWCPINPRSRFEGGVRTFFGEKDNPSFEADAKRGLMKVSYHYQVGKIGLDSHAGWVATVDGRQGDVFVQRFRFDSAKEYPDGSSVEFWHNGVGRIFAYNESKKAYIKDPTAGPYKDLVKSAERCTARVIHPGLPGDRSTKDIAKWIKRGEKYN